MVTPTFGEKQKLPDFLQDYGKLMSHFQAEFHSLGSKEKGDYFVNFAQRLVPHTEVSQRFEWTSDSQQFPRP